MAQAHVELQNKKFKIKHTLKLSKVVQDELKFGSDTTSLDQSATFLKLPAFGSAVMLGTCYDARTSSLINGLTFWNQSTLEQNVISKANTHVSTGTVIGESMGKKLAKFNISSDIKLSVLSGMIDLGGASGKFLKDTKKSNAYERVTYEFTSLSHWTSLGMETLASAKIEHPEVFDQDLATHFVIAVQYGCDAYFIFEQREGKKSSDSAGGASLHATISRAMNLTGEIGAESSRLNSADIHGIHCTYHGDVRLHAFPTSLESAIVALQELKTAANTIENAVPKTIYLYPISRLAAPDGVGRLAVSISSQLINNTEDLLDNLMDTRRELRMIVEDVDKDVQYAYENVSWLRNEIKNCISKLVRARKLFQSRLQELIPEIRRRNRREREISELLAIWSHPSSTSPTQQQQGSLFSKSNLSRMVSHYKEEIETLASTLQHLQCSDIQLNNNLFRNCTEDSTSTIVLQLNIANHRNDYASIIEQFLQNSTKVIKPSVQHPHPWLTRVPGGNGFVEDINYFVAFRSVEQNSSQYRFEFIILKPDPTNTAPLIQVFFYPPDSDREQIKFPRVESMKAEFVGPTDVTLTWLMTDKAHDYINISTNKDAQNLATEFILLPYITEVIVWVSTDGEDFIETQTIKANTLINDPLIKIDELQLSTRYLIALQLVTRWGRMPLSKERQIEVVTTDSDRGSMYWLIQHSKKIQIPDCNKTIYVPEMIDTDNETTEFKKYAIGGTNCTAQNKVIIFIGGVNSDKTMLLNLLVNYMYNVKFTDSFRFQLAESKISQEMTGTPTEHVTAYVFNNAKFKYRLTVVDTPEFGSERGITRDKEIWKQIRSWSEYESKQKGSDRLDAVCVVTKGTETEPTKLLQVANSTMALFANNMNENFIHLLTHCETPEAAKSATVMLFQSKMPCTSTNFVFNNTTNVMLMSDIVEGPRQWLDAMESMDKLFSKIDSLPGKSIGMSARVIRSREKLENLVTALQEKNRRNLNNLAQMQLDFKAIANHQKEIKEDRNFTYPSFKMKFKKQSIAVNCWNSINCEKCKYTCHENCWCQYNITVRFCQAIETFFGKCNSCPDQCGVSNHHSEPFVYRDIIVEVEQTLSYLKLKYSKEIIKGETNQNNEMLLNLAKDMIAVQCDDFLLVRKIRNLMKKLKESAILPHHHTDESYIKALISQEEAAQKPHFRHRIAQLKYQLEITRNIATIDVLYEANKKKSDEDKKKFLIDRFPDDHLLFEELKWLPLQPFTSSS